MLGTIPDRIHDIPPTVRSLFNADPASAQPSAQAGGIKSVYNMTDGDGYE
ncbi:MULTISPECIES: hypothetical protein [Bacillus]|nr:hypothetical protein [Bacillus glycinifermentans]MBU8786968.1 hypothetical protein [Bacillus glycinifermentans]